MFWKLIIGNVIGIIIYLIYRKIKKAGKYWEERGVPYIPPVPFLGNIAPALLRRESFAENGQKIYDMFPNDRYYGIFQLTLPTLVIRDPDLIKQMMVKDFDHFMDHRPLISKDVDPVFGRGLVALQGQEWRDMRSTLSPAFTSSKMRIMFSLMHETAEQFMAYFEKRIGDGEKLELEMKDTFTRYTNDVIASTAFGFKCDSLENRENEFYMMGKKAMDFGGFKVLRFFAYNILPASVMKFFKIRWIDIDCTNYFSDLILGAMKTREEQGIYRPDMIHMMMEAKKGRLKHEEPSPQDSGDGFSVVEESDVGKTSRKEKPELCDEDIIAQAFIFFLAGFDTSSSLLSFMAYELAVNPEAQEKLQAEIDKTLRNCEGGKLTYEALSSMKYMDMVITETLRKWPALPATDRRCVKPYTIEPIKPEERPVHIKEGDLLLIPIYMMHRNPQFYPNPDMFDPERYNEENKKNVHPYTYAPFGVGPRACIASRFALMQSKVVFTVLLSKLSFVTTDKTQIPLILSKNKFNMITENGTWVALKKRHE